MIIVHGLTIALIISAVESLKLLQENNVINRSQESDLILLLNMILNSYQKSPRRLNAASLASARQMYQKNTKGMSRSQIKGWLRDKAEEMDTNSVGKEQASLVEKELQSAITDHKSALLDRPYVEKMGRNDFLVMQSETGDSFVTVVPNSIYYNIEKKCVNWLDDCSLKGIRDRLLHGVQSP